MKEPIYITNSGGIQFQIIGGKLIEVEGYNSRQTSLKSLGNILRSYPNSGTKNPKTLRSIYYKYTASPANTGIRVNVEVDGGKNLSIGCVHFTGANAATLRRAALKSSKVIA